MLREILFKGLINFDVYLINPLMDSDETWIMTLLLYENYHI